MTRFYIIDVYTSVGGTAVILITVIKLNALGNTVMWSNKGHKWQYKAHKRRNTVTHLIH